MRQHIPWHTSTMVQDKGPDDKRVIDLKGEMQVRSLLDVVASSPFAFHPVPRLNIC